MIGKILGIIPIYRLSNKLYKKGYKRISKVLDSLNYYLHNSIIPASCEIGEGTMIAYGGIGIVIHGNSIIGKNCMIGQGITIGGKSGDKNEILRGYGGTPIIEDNVYSGIPEKIIIKITKENIEKYRDYGVRNCETVI
jgi:transferase hexapeptide repeat family protein